jgi:ubiquinone/menaquinone biosynthesis C-methylase UbiE
LIRLVSDSNFGLFRFPDSHTSINLADLHSLALDEDWLMQLSTDKIIRAVVNISRLTEPPLKDGSTHLDIGSGTGSLIALLRETHPGIRNYACDYTAKLMQLPNQKVDLVDLNDDCTLPYEAQKFDLVTCTEVTEHLENYRRLIREVYRVTKPSGTAIFTTPNVLSIQSRLRFLFFGFWNLFGPLPSARSETYSTFGHITPVPYFYLAHALAEAGFSEIRVDIDKIQRSGAAKLPFFFPLIKGFSYLAKRREISKYRTIDAGNAAFVEEMNTVKMLLGRTIVVTAKRAAARDDPTKRGEVEAPSQLVV